MSYIKKHKNKNEYLLTSSGFWVRNFTNTRASYVDINNFTQPKDYDKIVQNQLANETNRFQMIDNEKIFAPNCVIVSNGYNFNKLQHLLSLFPNKNVVILGVNRSLAKWDLTYKRTMNYYVVNNPYSECMGFLPNTHNYYPPCIASTKTYHDFLLSYRGIVSLYKPVMEQQFAPSLISSNYQVDDCRNPICAAINLAFHFNVVKLLLFCCDDSFEEERPGSVKIEHNGLYMYPQQQISHDLISAYAHWLLNQKTKKVKIANFSSGPLYNNILNVSQEDLGDFFNKE